MDARTAESLLNFSEGAGPRLRGLEAKAVFDQLDQQYGDLQLAMQWFIEQERADEAFRLASSLAAFWIATKRLDEGSAWFDRAPCVARWRRRPSRTSLVRCRVSGVLEG